ncbi:tetratricopeptide repeat protein [Tenacibaculum pacificus]|uniref:tetratricopeptide repeat protein n=1 Tax=Tenacibaculum pacificus TaxID=3018314 RepID=UPI0022F3CD00|nr:tetratricopeptide repeat protein [Tenacibaculum pacificus]WBX73208.1 tetratricopeptide repeat protein [Tenacibaculum pacificus]
MRFICYKKSYYLLFLIAFSTTIIAQESAINSETTADYHKAVKLYNNKAYAAAQGLFSEVSKNSEPHRNSKADADYYEAMCAIKLTQNNANDKVVAFVRNYPYHSKKEKAFLEVGNYYFANRKAAHALKWYQKVNEELLSAPERNELNYKMGYALLVSNYLKDAKERFKTLLGNPTYGNDARYYFGYVAYKQQNFGEAEDNLSQLANDATYQSKANYYILDISFKAGRFDKSADIGTKLLKKSKDKKEISEISKIVGESYFNLKKYNDAIPYLKAYKGKNGKWTNTDYYYLGYAYYQQKNYEEAIGNFNKIIGGNNKVAQNAYYHLGECYLESQKKTEALNAFKNASEMDFDLKITESASLSYAKLSYELGNPYKSVPEVLKDFLAKYPKSASATEISELLITSYLHQQDYQGALDYLATTKSSKNKNLANEVSLYRGIQLFNESTLKIAKPYFERATLTENQIVSNKGIFWLAETDYLLGNYQDALTNFLRITNTDFEESKKLTYNIAYTYFKLKDYKNSAIYFQQFLDTKLNDNNLNDDASNRLGDSYYASKGFLKAIASYEKVINEGGVGADYAQYQKAMSYGFMGKNNLKIEAFKTLINEYKDSQLQDDALFQLAATYTTVNNSAKAQETYDTLLSKHQSSNYIPNVLLRQGLLYNNDNQKKKALEKYKEVVAKHPNSKEAKQAVSNVKNIYIDLGKVDEYAVWVKDVIFINVTDADLDNATYQAAENKFLENNNTKAIIGFNKYLKGFPSGIHALKAHFYLAQAYNNTSQFNNAIPNYTYVITKDKNEFTEESLTKIAKIYLEKEDWNNGISVLEKLEKAANYPQNITFAQSNLMKGYYERKEYSKAITYAEKVLATDKIDTNISEDAKVIIARSAFKTNDFITAEEYFNEVSKNATGELKAESLYYNAFFLNENKDYEASNKAVQNLIANYSSYKYWGVKSYIVMAKNYYALNDAYQATYILENIIKNFTEHKDITEEASNELRAIKNKEAKTNESINSQN